jgi:hypothetical protein
MPLENKDSVDNPDHAYGYGPPVSQLLWIGERTLRGPKPKDYRALGVNESHLAELEKMSRDEALHDAASDSRAMWAPIHAMRAMIQIGSDATIEPLARLLEHDDTVDSEEIDEWCLEEIPPALGRMGDRALPRCRALLADHSKHVYSRLSAAVALAKMADQHPELRAQCVTALEEQLSTFERNDPEWNGWLVAELVHLKAVESAGAIERAFAADIVDETIVGDWDEVKASLGLRAPLSETELAEKARKRQAAHGWVSPQDMLDEEDDELIEEMMAPWDDSGTEAWKRLARDAEEVEEIDAGDDRPRMVMPDEAYSAEERRELAKQRNKERKAAERARLRDKQNRRRR